MACDNCRAKKVKCAFDAQHNSSRTTTCDYCRNHNLPCTTAPGKRQRALTNDGPSKRMRFGWARISEPLHVSGSQPNGQESSDRPSTTFLEFRRVSGSEVSYGSSESTLSQDAGALAAHDFSDLDPPDGLPKTTVQQRSRPGQDATPSLIDTILWSPEPKNESEDNLILVRHEDKGFEFTGPSSGISLLSNNGLKWILEKTEDEESVATLREFAEEITSHFAMPTAQDESARILEAMHAQLSPLPSIDVAGGYIQAYFDADQSWFPILDRDDFQRQVQLHACSDHSFPNSIPWYALYNTVLALGCRILGSKQSPSDEPARFAQAESEAQKYFQNALTVQAELIHRRTTVQTVQAFAAMTLYAQHSTTIQCEYKFCSMAVRLAQGMGMHKKVSPQSDITATEIEDRSRVFWILYWMDKTISLRMGRPSAINDAEVSCPLPRDRRASSDGFSFYLSSARYARTCSQIISQMYSTKALSLPPLDLLDTAEDLEVKLQRWHEDIPESARLHESMKGHSEAGSSGIPHLQSVALEFFYNYAICAIYRRFSAQTFWHTKALPSANDHTATRMAGKARKCGEASRIMCLLTSNLEVHAYSPSWLLIYYPLSGLINVFTCVVSDPLIWTAKTDIALMDMVTGFFGKLEFCTSGGMAFTKTAELSRLARKAVKKARRDKGLDNRPSTSQGHSNSSIPRNSETSAADASSTESSSRTPHALAVPTPGSSWLDCPDWADMNIGSGVTDGGGVGFDINLEAGTQLEHNFGFNSTSPWSGTWNMDLLV